MFKSVGRMIGSDKNSATDNSRHSSIEDGGNLLYKGKTKSGFNLSISCLSTMPNRYSMAHISCTLYPGI